MAKIRMNKLTAIPYRIFMGHGTIHAFDPDLSEVMSNKPPNT